MAKVQLRLKTRDGQFLLDSLTKEDSVLVLKAMVLSLTGLDVNNCRVKVGYPPEELFLVDDGQQIGEIFPSGRELLTIEEGQSNSGVRSSKGVVHPEQAPRKSELFGSSRTMRRVQVAANNSCLFVSVYYCMSGEMTDKCPELRQLIAEAVRSNPTLYNEGFLEKPNAEYCKWIMNEDRWGGAIELAILCNHFQVEMVAVDIQNVRLNRFGEDKNFAKRIFLLFDGIHYDPLVVDCPSKKGETLFSVADQEVMCMALELAKSAKASHEYTDLKSMTLKCDVCHQALTQDNARSHAKLTGHLAFSEIKH